jgi:hypothetical protein
MASSFFFNEGLYSYLERRSTNMPFNSFELTLTGITASFVQLNK